MMKPQIQSYRIYAFDQATKWYKMYDLQIILASQHDKDEKASNS